MSFILYMHQSSIFLILRYTRVICIYVYIHICIYMYIYMYTHIYMSFILYMHQSSIFLILRYTKEIYKYIHIYMYIYIPFILYRVTTGHHNLLPNSRPTPIAKCSTPKYKKIKKIRIKKKSSRWRSSPTTRIAQCSTQTHTHTHIYTHTHTRPRNRT